MQMLSTNKLGVIKTKLRSRVVHSCGFLQIFIGEWSFNISSFANPQTSFKLFLCDCVHDVGGKEEEKGCKHGWKVDGNDNLRTLQQSLQLLVLVGSIFWVASQLSQCQHCSVWRVSEFIVMPFVCGSSLPWWSSITNDQGVQTFDLVCPSL